MNELALRGNNPHSEVIIIQALLHGYPAKLLLDSGASGNFIKESFINQIQNNSQEKLDIMTIDEKNIKLADGSIIISNHFIPKMNTEIHGRNVKNSFIVLNILNNKFD